MSENSITQYQQPAQQIQSIYANQTSFATGQRIAQALAASNIVPESYQNNLPNCMIALEMANRIGTSPLLVMQNMHVIQGRPSWSSTFLIASINSCGKFSPLRFRIEKLGKKTIEATIIKWVNREKVREKTSLTIEDMSCIAYATELATNEVMEGPAVTMEMAVNEGWFTKTDSKWKTMPDLMIRYRAAAFFVRLYAPEIAMGMHTQDEVQDVEYTVVESQQIKPSNNQSAVDLNSIPSAPAPASVSVPEKKEVQEEPKTRKRGSKAETQKNETQAIENSQEQVSEAQIVDDDDEDWEI